ncbi:MAG: hypothetical protein JSV16_09165 [Candidatus Hydrogenedentota bacterium]|nr:MAG: hypothetical protein JSV16_09165 [Candidatus Hydrogenedentota bacterium]
MSLKASDLLKNMLAAAKGEFEAAWPDVKDYAKSAFKNLAETMVMIGRLELEGKVTRKQAKLLLDIQKNTARTVMLTIEGMGILAVERAINAALKAVQETVNTALGWKLL